MVGLTLNCHVPHRVGQDCTTLTIWIVIGAWLRVHGFFYTCYIYTPSAITVIVVSVRAPDLFGGHNIWIEDRGVYICISEYLLGPVYTSKSSLFLFARKNISVSLDSWLQGVGKEQDYSSVPFLLLCWARKKNRMDGMNRLVWCWLVITESERKKWNSLAINTRNPVFHSMFGY